MKQRTKTTLWIVEWSERKQWLRIDSLSDLLRKNREAYFTREGLDWTPVAATNDLDEAERMIARLKASRRRNTPRAVAARLDRLRRRKRRSF